ncbi:MAG: hypothetical protein CO023_00745 [Flavobacteriales bacterium CG_4_9_14_0_2_um_filter_35_242]|nr:hypothetical protein [Zetaproteobacteria bacterium]NDK17827.1 hypothetical protein [Flavobacteriales bacterium]OIO10312.1 MAG: hypothetical protein AUJ53_07235 [Flavobacteriaceae bacterium CG1_02_35_72]PIR14207.1 MAG: hypothetical protein COV50_04115 [Flavobacteriales bacterium CG11_big_fil_rev_8_21_14_0_20_35_7]PIV15965.1 MAG: hypothetical protein COS42_12490 [Flavobacteriales bacterium CG03_land_8_20_14_0_80_35_15]PIX05972.1 MAG: hypothetical protein COZ76_11345 [Flavobacteriales bacteriu
METKLLHLGDLKFNLDVWLRELKFHNQELDFFEKKLEEISVRKLGHEAMIPLEKFQNQITKERDVLNKLKHRIKFKKNLLDNLSDLEIIDKSHLTKQVRLSEEIATFNKLNGELKFEMMTYFLDWL